MRWDLFWRYLNGPRVYRKYRDGTLAGSPSTSPSGTYRTNILEEYCSLFVGIIETCMIIALYTALYTSPYWAFRAATRRTIFGMSPEFALKYAIGAAFVYGVALLCRACGRVVNDDYLTFLDVLFSAAQPNDNISFRQYDFDFRYWPIDYEWRETDKNGEKIPARRYLPEYTWPPDESLVKKIVWGGLSFVVAHTLAHRFAYPGTLAILQLPPAFFNRHRQGRAKLVEQMNGQRFKLKTKTGIEIDTMFVDRRNNQKFANGNILVITCEGNFGFYEVGSAATPLAANYSVFMWNHPGFGGSTGTPWPSEEAAAIDVVIQFALNHLGWAESKIVMYGWSIGGFTATWAGMNYGNLRALVLDATFDDIVPVALQFTPASLVPLVERTIRTYLNLHIERQLDRYDGPVSIVRRLQDEVMAMEGVHDLDAMRKVNRANNLLKDLLLRRYPNVFGDDAVKKVVDEWLAATVGERVILMDLYGVDFEECRAAIAEFVGNNQENDVTFPLLIGYDKSLEWKIKLGLYLTSVYLVEFDSTHCEPLPVNKFAVPNHPWE